MSDEPVLVVDRPDQGRYEIVVDDQVAFLDYRRRDEFVVLVHTEVPESLRGRGLGAVLARYAMDDARRLGLGVVVKCPYVSTWLRRHPEYNDIVKAKVAEDPRWADESA